MDYTGSLPKIFSCFAILVLANATFSAAPVAGNVNLSSSTSGNYTIDDLSLVYNITDADGDSAIGIVDWRRNGSSIAILNMPFDTNVSDAGSGSVKDYSISGNNATLGGGTASYAPTWTPNGMIGGAYNFDGIDDVIILANNTTLNVGTGNFSIEVWVRKNGTHVNSWDEEIFCKWVYPDSTGYCLAFAGEAYNDWHTGTIRWILGRGTSYTEGYTAQTYNDDSWHHVVWTVDRQGYSKIYVDGVEDEKAGISSFASVNINSTRDVYIGARSNGGYFFNGTMDEFRFYPYVLQQAKISYDYQQGLANHTLTTIPASETEEGDTWQASVTPTDGNSQGEAVLSNSLTIAPPVYLDACTGSLQNNTYYVLNQSISDYLSTCFTLDNLAGTTLDCRNYAVDGTGTDGTAGFNLTSSSSAIRVWNCSVSGFETGMLLDSANSSLANLTSWQNSQNGISVSSNGSNISSITSLSNGGNGIYITGALNNLASAVLESNSLSGLTLNGTSNNTLQDITTRSNALFGINLADSPINSFYRVANELDYNGTDQKFYSDQSQAAFSYNKGHWPLYLSNGSDATSQAATAWYSGNRGSGRNADGTSNSTLRFFRSLLNYTTTPNNAYSDVLLVSVQGSSDSLAISQYFIDRRGVENVVEVYLPDGENTPMRVSVLNASVVAPIKEYVGNCTGCVLNYIVLTKGMPTYTDEADYASTGGSNYNASSVDSELALVGGSYEIYIGKNGKLANPYYNASSFFTTNYPASAYNGFVPFSHAAFGIYLVTRLDGFNVSDVIGMIDRSANISKHERNHGSALLVNTAGAFQTEIRRANTTLNAAGFNITINDTGTYSQTATIPNIFYTNVSYADFYQYNSFVPAAFPNMSWLPGGLASPRYSFTARQTSPSYHGNIDGLSADMISQGATAAYGCSEEPFVSGSNKPDILAYNFVQDQYYADMLWNAVPHLSWSTLFFADPKASYPKANVSISPVNPADGQEISCNLTLHHAPSLYLNVSFEWFLNGTNQTSLAGSLENVPVDTPVLVSNLSSEIINQSDSWECNVNVYINGKYSSSQNDTKTMRQACNTTVSAATTLAGNMSCPGENGLVLEGSDYVFEGLNYSIIGNSSSGHSGLVVGGTNITVQNVKLVDFENGVKVIGGSSNSFFNLQASLSAASTNCVLLDTATGNYFTNSTFTACATALSISSNSTGNFFYYNHFNNAGLWVNNSGGSSNSFNTSVSGAAQGNFYVGAEDMDLASSAGTIWADGGSDYPIGQTTASDRWVGGGADYGPALAAMPLQSCGSLGVANTAYTLLSNVSITGSTCFNVTAENVTLECRGFSMTGNNASGTYGISTNQFNTTIRNCRVSNFSTAIYFNTADNGTVSNTTASTTRSGGYGIYLYNGANYNTIANSTGTSTSGYGIYLLTSSNNTIANSTGTSTSNRGIYLQSSSGNNITNSTGTSTSGYGYGIDLYSSSNNTISNSTFTSTSGYGIELAFSSNNNITNSTGTSTSGYGIYVYSSSNNTITGSSFTGATDIYLSISSISQCSNTIADNTGTGGKPILYYNNSPATVSGIDVSTIILCNASHSGITNSNATSGGIKIFYSNYSNITNANATSNTSIGIRLQSSSSNNIANSTGTSNSDFGIVLDSSSNNTISNSTGASNSYIGIWLFLSSNNTITNSTFTSNSYIGIDLQSSSNNNIANSTFTSASGTGIYISYSSSNTITNSTGTSNTSIGIYLDSSSNNTITNSTATSTSGYGIYLDEISNYNTIANSTGTSTSGTGIYTGSSSYNNFTNISAISNTGRGFEIYYGTGNNVANSTISSGSDYALYNYYYSTNSFLQNTITGASWVYCLTNGAGNTLNDSFRGNTYYFVNGTGSWVTYDIVDLDNNSYADAGSSLPFNSSTVGGNFSGSCSDWHPYIQIAAYGNASNISATGLSDLVATIANTSNFTGRGYGDNIPVNVTSGGFLFLNFSFNFSSTSLNFSEVQLVNSTTSQGPAGYRSYASSSGIPQAGLIAGTKTISISGANPAYDAVCVRDQENATASFSLLCGEAGEIIVPCNGTAGGITCTLSGNTLSVSGLSHSSFIIQYQYMAGSPQGSSSGSAGGNVGAGEGRKPPVQQQNPIEEQPQPEVKPEPSSSIYPPEQPSQPQQLPPKQQLGEEQEAGGQVAQEQGIEEKAMPIASVLLIGAAALTLALGAGIYIYFKRKGGGGSYGGSLEGGDARHFEGGLPQVKSGLENLEGGEARHFEKGLPQVKIYSEDLE